MLQVDPIVVPPGNVVTTNAPGVQMVLDKLVEVPTDASIVQLGDADRPAMLELATLTKPGPFAARTSALGQFVGVKQDGQLIARA